MKDTIKREKEKDWEKAINFIPKKDELIIYDCDDGSIKLKIGDGATKVNDLDFNDDNNFVNVLGCRLVLKDEGRE